MTILVHTLNALQIMLKDQANEFYAHDNLLGPSYPIFFVVRENCRNKQGSLEHEIVLTIIHMLSF